MVTKEGISIDPKKIKAIEYWPVPKDVTDVRSFMGITDYYRRFIKGFLRIANHITYLQKKGKKFDWNKKCEDSFKKLKTLLTTAPILRIVDPNKYFIVCTDACNHYYISTKNMTAVLSDFRHFPVACTTL